MHGCEALGRTLGAPQPVRDLVSAVVCTWLARCQQRHGEGCCYSNVECSACYDTRGCFEHFMVGHTMMELMSEKHMFLSLHAITRLAHYHQYDADCVTLTACRQRRCYSVGW